MRLLMAAARLEVAEAAEVVEIGVPVGSFRKEVVEVGAMARAKSAASEEKGVVGEGWARPEAARAAESSASIAELSEEEGWEGRREAAWVEEMCVQWTKRLSAE